MRDLYADPSPIRAMRCKGIFHTDRGWMLIEADERSVFVSNSQYRRDSRVEIIASKVSPQGWAAVEASLLEAALDVNP